MLSLGTLACWAVAYWLAWGTFGSVTGSSLNDKLFGVVFMAMGLDFQVVQLMSWWAPGVETKIEELRHELDELKAVLRASNPELSDALRDKSGLWKCSCGAWNLHRAEKCHRCKKHRYRSDSK